MRPEVTRSRYIRHALTLHYYVSLALGIVSLRYDFRARRFTRPPLLAAYALLANALTICILPISIPASLKSMNFYGDNRLMRLTQTCIICVRCVVLALTLLTRWRRESRSKAIVAQLLAIEAEYFEAFRVPPRIQRRFTRLFCAKFCSGILQTLIYASVFIMRGEFTPRRVLRFLYTVSVVNMLLGVMFHYFVALWHIYKRFCILNAQLAAVFRKLKRHEQKKIAHSATEARLLAAELQTIARLHYRLTQLVLQLNDIYKYQVMSVLLTQILNNIAMGYYAIIIGGNVARGNLNFGRMHLSYFEMLLGLAMFLVTLLDLFLMDVIFDGIAAATRQTGAILRRFHELAALEVSLARSCHLLSQQLMLQQLRVEICGMFVLDKSAAFIIFGATINKIFILVQFDMEKRFG